MRTKKIESTMEELIELNDKFHKKQIIGDVFYSQLIKAGFSFSQCILISIFPDSSNTYCGKIIDRDGNVTKFDIDLDSYESSCWEDITENFNQLYQKEKLAKPWLKEVVAYNLSLKIKNNKHSVH